MNKSTAKQIIAQGVTWDELRQVLVKARADGAADERVSTINPSFSKAAAFNIMVNGFDGTAQLYAPQSIRGSIVAGNILREFGEYLDTDKYALPKRKAKPTVAEWHEEPVDFGDQLVDERTPENGGVPF